MQKIVCIPAFNESYAIGELIDKIKKNIEMVVVCDDGSTDDTKKIAMEHGAIVIEHEKKLGKGEALKTLFNYAKKSDADIMVTIDGDGQFLPEEIPNLIKPIVDDKADVVIGYRFDDADQMPTYRKVGNKVLDKVTNLAADLPFRDSQGGFRAYSRKAFEKIRFSTSGFGIDAEILVNAVNSGLRVAEEKVTVIYDTGGKTSTKNPISHTSEVVFSLIDLIAQRHPLRFLGLPGILLIALGIVLTIHVLDVFNEIRYFSIPFTLGAFGSLALGLILLLMSVILYSISSSTKNLR
ncbi:MAG: glycosyltransferase family 2 protein [Nitrosopumilus sp.]|nr:glycosyltransferase family 2 protein [Nitrosopumilus sp.]